MITAGSSVTPLTGLLLANINWYFIPKHLDLSLSCIDWVSLKLPQVVIWSEKAPVPNSISRNLLFSSICWPTWWMTAHACSSEMGAEKLRSIWSRERHPSLSRWHPRHGGGGGGGDQPVSASTLLMMLMSLALTRAHVTLMGMSPRSF